MTFREIRDELDAIDELFVDIWRQRKGLLGGRTPYKQLWHALKPDDYRRLTDLRLKLDRVLMLEDQWR